MTNCRCRSVSNEYPYHEDGCPEIAHAIPHGPSERREAGNLEEEFVCTCGSKDCWREEADIGVGTLKGPWHCNDCGATHREPPSDEMFSCDEDTEDSFI